MIVHPPVFFNLFNSSNHFFPLPVSLLAVIYRPIITASVLRVFIFIEEFRNYD